MAWLADPASRSRALRLLVAALLATETCVVLAALLAWIYPGEDARYALAWGDELARLHVPDFDGPLPAKHPLTLLVGIVLAPLGVDAAMVAYGAISVATFALAGYAVFRLAEALGGPVAGGIAAAIALTRPAVLDQLMSGGKDLPFATFVLLAATIVVRHSTRRPRPVFVLLALAGLIRPEAWLVGGLFWLWLLWERRREALAPATIALVLAAPLIWCGLDLLLTGDPLQTLHHGQGKSEELAAAGFAPASAAPESWSARLGAALDAGLPATVGWGVLLAAALLIAATLRRRWRRPGDALRGLIVPLVIPLASITFTALAAIAGFTLPGRFLLLAALALVAAAASAAGRSNSSWVAGLALLLAVAGTLLMVPGDADQVHRLAGEREQMRDYGDGVIALAARDAVGPAIDSCPELAVGGTNRGKISLAQTLVALATGRDVSDFALGRPQLLRQRGSAFAYELGPAHPAFGRDLPPAWRARTALREGPWTFASRC